MMKKCHTNKSISSLTLSKQILFDNFSSRDDTFSDANSQKKKKIDRKGLALPKVAIKTLLDVACDF